MNVRKESNRTSLEENLNYSIFTSNHSTEIDYKPEENSLPAFLYELDDETSKDQLENLVKMLHTASAYSSHALPQHHAQHSHVHSHHNHRLVNGRVTPPYGGVNSPFYRQSPGTSAFYHAQHPSTYHHHHHHPHTHTHTHTHAHHTPATHQVSNIFIFN